MASHNDFGREAEQKAIEFLERSGYEIVKKNWRYRKAEIDVIAKKGNELIIVEVKARSSKEVMAPEEAVTASKIKLLILAVDQYVVENELDVEVRFDIISILKNEGEWEITHIEDAFDALL